MQLHDKLPMNVKGFTLIELMLAMVIGLFLMAGVFTVYVNGSVAQDNTEKQSRLVDDARFAIEAITSDLRYSGFWGKTNTFEYLRGELNANSNILPKTVGAVLPPITTATGPDCGVNWYNDLQRAFNASNGTNLFAGTCIGAEYVANTDVLVTKYASATPILAENLEDAVVYVYANYSSFGEIFIGKTAPTFLDDAPDIRQRGTIHRLRTRVYYIDKDTEGADGYPSMHRLDLDAGPKLANTMLLPGVENLQVQYGIDNNGDGSVNLYVDPDPLDLILQSQVVSVQVWVTVRSRDVELPVGIKQTIKSAGVETVHDDGFRRIVMSSVVLLRNKRTFDTTSGS